MTCPVSHQRTEWIDHFTGICSQLTWVLPAPLRVIDGRMVWKDHPILQRSSRRHPHSQLLYMELPKVVQFTCLQRFNQGRPWIFEQKHPGEIPETVSKGKNCKHNGFFGSQSQPSPDILMVQESVFISSMIFLSGMLSHNRMLRIGWQKMQPDPYCRQWCKNSNFNTSNPLKALGATSWVPTRCQCCHWHRFYGHDPKVNKTREAMGCESDFWIQHHCLQAGLSMSISSAVHRGLISLHS